MAGSSTTDCSVHNRLQELFGYIRSGRILDAINEFYAEDAVMQENNARPTVGRQANLERERQFMSTVKEWKRFDVTAQGIGDNVTLYETVMGWIRTGRRFTSNRSSLRSGGTARLSTNDFIMIKFFQLSTTGKEIHHGASKSRNGNCSRTDCLGDHGPTE
ncbi:MAG: hypothetical protein CV089_01205 [Nitrospira sp. WS110]|nr:hypothetical protein [Nitrospira sp. WS110]